jgi:sulfur carrier protein
MALRLTINGQVREFDELTAGVSLVEVIAAMNLKSDRVAVEHNGEIAQRARWAEVSMNPGDRLEVVHFVGGGVAAPHLRF